MIINSGARANHEKKCGQMSQSISSSSTVSEASSALINPGDSSLPASNKVNCSLCGQVMNNYKANQRNPIMLIL